MRRLDATLADCWTRVGLELNSFVTKAASSRRTPKTMPKHEYKSFAEFWPHYVAEHSRQQTRLLHLVGTAIALGWIAYFAAVGRWWLVPLALIPGYGLAWISHFFIEKNKPATFQYPLWSFMGDYKMIWMMLTGKIDGVSGRNIRRFRRLTKSPLGTKCAEDAQRVPGRKPKARRADIE